MGSAIEISQLNQWVYFEDLVFHHILKHLQDTAAHFIRTYGNCPVYKPGAAGAEIARHHQDYALNSA
jgi:hypothetical protein